VEKRTYYPKKELLKTVFGIVYLIIFDLFYTIIFYLFASGILRQLNLLPEKPKLDFGSICLFFLIFSGVATAFSIGFASDKDAKEFLGFDFGNLFFLFVVITVLLFFIFLLYILIF